jgi:hypothetical protein
MPKLSDVTMDFSWFPKMHLNFIALQSHRAEDHCGTILADLYNKG